MDSSYPAHGPQTTRSLDPVPLWTVDAAATGRMRLNAGTLSTFYYEPPHLDRLPTTLAVLGDGRLGVGVEPGWTRQEHDIARNADRHRRGRTLDDMPAFLHAWWTTDPVSWDSEFLALPPVHAGLRPVQMGGRPTHLDRRCRWGRDAPRRPTRGRSTRQSHPRATEPRSNRRMKKVH